MNMKMNKDRISILAAFIALGISGLFVGLNADEFRTAVKEKLEAKKAQAVKEDFQKLATQVLPQEGFSLPISWGDLGPRLVKLGVIDLEKFEEAVNPTEEQLNILTKKTDEKIKINQQNGQFVVDVLWALGLAQKSVVYDEGPLGKEYQGELGNFASTGGWTLAQSEAVDYLNRFDLISLSPEQQKRVGGIAKGVFRPCCGNSTWFPDCNHGMAALAAIELLVDAGMTDEEIYKAVLKLNSFWFPDTYLTTAVYFENKGVAWDKVDAKEVLGEEFSSGKGASEIAKEVGPLPFSEVLGGSCGV